MSGDYSKDSFDALRDYAGVFLQQGRAVLDSDWNEMVAIFERRIRTGTVDTIGRAVVPRETPRGFEIRFAGAGIEIGEGNFYLDGVLYQNHGLADFDRDDPARPDPVFDRARQGANGPEGVLDEMIAPAAGDYLSYEEQPYWPTPDPLPGAGTHLVYLAGWQREVTATVAPELLDPALGGLDTTTRWQSVWQVRVLPNVGANATCASPDDELAGWIDTIAPSTARLTTGTVDVDDPEDPCLVPPTEGYTGVENQFYRVELHAVRDPDTASDPPVQTDWGFKFSRENASVRTVVEAIAADAESVAVGRIGRDEVLRFAPGDWVEITDDIREFNHRSGQMLRVADVDPETREVEFEAAVEADLIPSGAPGDTLASRHTRLIRWDQRGIIRLDDGTEWTDLDADTADGLIPVPPAGSTVVLESAITVAFNTAPGPGGFREMDHWRFAARTAGTQIEILNTAPPEGIQRHHARLALLRPGTPNQPGNITDCRIFWPPLFEGGEGCACTVCVTAEGHNSGALTIQAAIDQVGPLGGTVCLEAGLYALSQPVVIANSTAIRVVGQGLGTVLGYQGTGGAVRVETSNDIKLERFTVIAVPGADPDGNIGPVHGVTANNTTLFAVRRLGVLVASPNPEDRFDFGIALDGIQVATKVEECLSIAPHALGSRSTYGRDDDGDLQVVALAELRVLDCIFFGGRVAVLFDRAALNIAAAVLSRNLVLSLDAGIRIALAELPAASLSIDNSTVVADHTAVSLSAGTVRVQDNEISGGEEVGDGLRLAPPLVPEFIGDAQVTGNTIFDLAGVGIRVSGAHDTIFIKRNIIRDIGLAGILTDPGASVRHIAVDNNAIDRVGLTPDNDFAIGIGLIAVESGQIIGNSIRNVGEAGSSGQIYAGIAAQGFGSVDINSNLISDIGRGEPESTSIGILARQPFLGVNIGTNRIFGDISGSDELTTWRAIQIGDVSSNQDTGDVLGPAANGYLAALPGLQPTSVIYFNVADETWRASATSFAVALPAILSQVTVTGNHARAGMRLTGAMVSVLDPGSRGVAFAHNQCDLQAGFGLSEVVFLGAPRLTVTANTITHSVDALSLRIVTSANGATTPVGNITTAGISVSPGGMPTAFAGLNLTA
jgi:hypothetical protein